MLTFLWVIVGRFVNMGSRLPPSSLVYLSSRKQLESRVKPAQKMPGVQQRQMAPPSYTAWGVVPWMHNQKITSLWKCWHAKPIISVFPLRHRWNTVGNHTLWPRCWEPIGYCSMRTFKVHSQECQLFCWTYNAANYDSCKVEVGSSSAYHSSIKSKLSEEDFWWSARRGNGFSTAKIARWKITHCLQASDSALRTVFRRRRALQLQLWERGWVHNLTYHRVVIESRLSSLLRTIGSGIEPLTLGG